MQTRQPLQLTIPKPFVPIVPASQMPPMPTIPAVTAVTRVTVPPVPKPAVITVTVPQIPKPTVPTVPIPAVPIPRPATTATLPKIAPLGQPLITLPLRPQAASQGVKDVTLMDYQVEWANRAHSILLCNHGYIDTSRMRSGKTYVLLWLAKRFKFPLIVIGPVTALEEFKRVAQEYGVEMLCAVSYQSLRSKRGIQPKHGLLYRHDNLTEGGVKQVHFTPTPYYVDLIRRGAMLVCDEIHNIKNNSAQYKASSALIREIITGGGRSRFALLSGTPFDKEEHATNLLRLIGYVRSPKMYRYDHVSQTIILQGMQELIDACRSINAAETDRLLQEIPPTRKKMTHLAYTLYIRVVKTGISGAMAPPVRDAALYSVGNGFFTMTGQHGQQLHDALAAFARAVNYNDRTREVDWQARNIGDVTPAMVRVENSKVDDFARVATGILMEAPENKVIISVNYTSTIDELATLLIFYNPIILHGQTPKAKRGILVKEFNENPARRLFIMNTAVGGVGISLYSPTHNFRPHMLISPSYKLADIVQASARVYGPGAHCPATVRMFYGRNGGEQEANILEAIARKTQVLKGTLEDIVTRDMVLPGDYQAFYEN